MTKKKLFSKDDVAAVGTVPAETVVKVFDTAMELTEQEQAQSRVVDCFTLLQQERDRLAKQESDLKKQKSVVEHLETVLCDAIEECQTLLGTKTPVILADGTSLKVESKYYGNISKENLLAAVDWLTKNKLDNLLKTRVTIEFGRNELGMAKRFEEILRAAIPQYPVAITLLDDSVDSVMMGKIETLLETVVLARDIEVDTGMHSSTLKAFVKKQFATGKSWPAELFGAFERREPVIKSPHTKEEIMEGVDLSPPAEDNYGYGQ